MALSPIITFRGVRPSRGLAAAVRQHAAALDTYFSPIIACEVLLEFSEKRHEAGNRYHVRINLAVPGREIVVAHEANQRARARALGLSKLPRGEEADLERRFARLTIRKAFDAARRQLQDYARRQRRDVKRHGPARIRDRVSD